MIMRICVLFFSANFLSAMEEYAGGGSHERDEAITEALSYLPDGTKIHAELLARRVQVARIWTIIKPLKGVQSRVVCILYDNGCGTYDMRWYKKPINRKWYSWMKRFFGQKDDYEYSALI